MYSPSPSSHELGVDLLPFTSFTAAEQQDTKHCLKIRIKKSITYHSSFTYCICIKMNTPRSRSRSRRQVRFSDRSNMCIVNNLSPELWYSQDEMDLFGAQFCHCVRKFRSQLRDYNDQKAKALLSMLLPFLGSRSISAPS
eukprot:scaffold2578_cov136-Skeletonema_menzelii.AAC.13